MAELATLRPPEALPSETLRRAVEAVRRGEIIAFPTDTVYGLGTSAFSREGVERLYLLKGRKKNKPLPLLAVSTEEARRWVEWTPQAEALARKFWPGGLTLVLRSNTAGRTLACAQGDTLAVRVPANNLARQILQASQVPWASTSANRTGEPFLADGTAVARAFGPELALVVDSGPAPGRSSSVVDAMASPALVLREGVIPPAEILAVQPRALFVCAGNTCRSLMAQLLLDKLSKERGLGWVIESAGTAAQPWLQVPLAVRAALKLEGIEGFFHAARRLTLELVAAADLVLVMEQRHREEVLALGPEFAYKVRTLKDTDVADPIGKSDSVYAACLREIKESLIEAVKSHERPQDPRP